MGDPLSTVASIIALILLTSSVVTYLRNIKDASKECKKLELEITSMRGALDTLKETHGRCERLWRLDGHNEVTRTAWRPTRCKIAKCYLEIAAREIT